MKWWSWKTMNRQKVKSKLEAQKWNEISMNISPKIDSIGVNSRNLPGKMDRRKKIVSECCVQSTFIRFGIVLKKAKQNKQAHDWIKSNEKSRFEYINSTHVQHLFYIALQTIVMANDIRCIDWNRMSVRTMCINSGSFIENWTTNETEKQANNKHWLDKMAGDGWED